MVLSQECSRLEGQLVGQLRGFESLGLVACTVGGSERAVGRDRALQYLANAAEVVSCSVWRREWKGAAVLKGRTYLQIRCVLRKHVVRRSRALLYICETIQLPKRIVGSPVL